MTVNTLQKNVKILDQAYQISYAEGTEKSLDTAVRFLNEQLAETQKQNQNATTVRLMAVTALNLAHQLMKSRHSHEAYERQMNERLKNINDVISKKTYSTSPLKEFGANL